MASIPRSRGHGLEQLREPEYVPVSASQQIAQLICEAFADPHRSVRLSLLDVTADRITLSVVTEEQPRGERPIPGASRSRQES